VVQPDGSWSLTPKDPLIDGAHSLTTTETDPAGNTSAAGPALPFTVDTSAVIVSITHAVDNVGAIQANVADNGATDDTTPELIGTATAGATVTIREGATVIGTTTAGPTGAWSLLLPAQGEGAHVYTASATNAAGTTGTVDFHLSIDTTAAAIPAVTGVSDDVGSIQGPVANAGFTDDTTPALSGTGPASTTINVYDDAKLIGTTVSDASGNWSYTPVSPLAQGLHSVTAASVDAVGNVSAQSPARTFTVDTAAPDALAAPTLTDDVGAIVGLIADNAITDDGKPTYAGTAPAGVATVKVYDNGMYLGTSSVQPDGKWSFEPALPLASGPHSLQVSAVDAAGNEGPLSVAKPFTVAGDAPAAPAITLVNDNVGALQGSLQPNASTDDTTPTISGTGTPGTTIKLYANGQEVGTTTVAGDGTWSVTPTLSGDGLKNLTATATDGAGQSSPSTGAYPIVLDTSAPATPAAPTATDDLAPTIGVIVPGGTTNDATPVIIRGVEGPPGKEVFIPVAVVGSSVLRVESARPLEVVASQPVKIEADQPIPVTTGNEPLLIKTVSDPPAFKPGVAPDAFRP